MRNFSFCVKRIFFLVLTSASLSAIDVDPSKKTVPEKFINPGGNRFSIFAGDPERIKKANSIEFSDFEGKVLVNPVTLSLTTAESQFKSLFKVTIGFVNKGKRTYTLSYPNSQRYDILIKNPSGQIVYQWSADKAFMEVMGTSLVNPGDKISFVESISLNDFIPHPTPGIYSIEVALANYPELTAKSTLTLTP